MKDMDLHIPAEIASMPDLTLIEKIALHHISQFPAFSNKRLGAVLGRSERTVKNIVAKLRDRGLILMRGHGRGRRYTPTFKRELTGNDCPIHEAVLSGRVCPIPVSPPSRTPLADAIGKTMQTINEMCHSGDGYAATIVMLLNNLIHRITQEAPDGDAKTAAIADLETRRNAFFAVTIANNAPKDERRRLDNVIASATPEQLAEFFYRAHGQLLADQPKRVLTDCLQG